MNKIKIIHLAETLSLLGHRTESSILLKIAAPPLKGVVPLDKWEPPDFGPTEDDEGNPVESVWQRIKRDKKIRRDKRSREDLKREMEKSSIPIEEQEEAELGGWYKAIEEIADSVILIPFDKDDLDHNDEALMGLSAVFGFGFHPKNYKDFFDNANMLYGRYKQGDVDTLKTIFPALWADIQDILNEKNLSENEVVFMLYNQDTSPRLPNFTKDPFFFGHDMGHNVFDSEDGDWEFKGILSNFISEIYKLYISEVDEDEGIESTSAYDDMGGEVEDEIIQAQLSNFFSNKSGKEDAYGDVFQAVASGNLTVHIPDFISEFDKWYDLPPENKPKAEELKNKVIAELKTYMNSNAQYGTIGSGPLSNFTGSVVLNDV